jgi:hypothetical protein
LAQPGHFGRDAGKPSIASVQDERTDVAGHAPVRAGDCIFAARLDGDAPQRRRRERRLISG